MVARIRSRQVEEHDRMRTRSLTVSCSIVRATRETLSLSTADGEGRDGVHDGVTVVLQGRRRMVGIITVLGEGRSAACPGLMRPFVVGQARDPTHFAS
jgi:hypothetical protein